MNYTTNHHLPQWAKEDRIMMEDFNQMCADIDEGIAKAQEAKYVVGSYLATGSPQKIELGFMPSFVFVQSTFGTNDSYGNPYSMVVTSESKYRITITNTGFQVHSRDATIGEYPEMNKLGRTYAYIAFR